MLGWLLGIAAGLLPGVHSNTISFLLLGLAAANPGQPDKWAYAIVGMNVVQVFVDWIPNTFLGMPDHEGYAHLMPAHRFLAKGKGVFAVRLGVLGALSGLPLALLAFPLFAAFLTKTTDFVQAGIPVALVLVLASMVGGEEGWNKLRAALVIGLAGALGLLTLGGSAFTEPLFPAVTGLFGVPGLLYSLKARNRVPPQQDSPEPLAPKNLLEGSVLGCLAAGLTALLPAIGPGEASFLLMKFARRMSPSLYLLLAGCINACNLLFSFLFLYLLGKTRTGAAAALAQLQPLDANWLLAFAGASLVSAAFGAWATVALAKAAARELPRLNYALLTKATLAFLAVVVGLLVLGVATCIGLLPLAWGIRRAHGMAYLMVPTLAYYLGFA